MEVTHTVPAPDPRAPDRLVGALVRDAFEADLQERIAASMDRQLAVFLAGTAERRLVAAA